VPLKKRIANEYVEIGMNSRALDAWRELTRSNPNDVDALQSMGETELAMNDFNACRESFHAAHAEARAELCAAALGLDPTVRGLSSREQRRRDKTLLADVRQELAACNATSPATSVDSDDLELAERLWRQRATACTSPPRPDSPVARVMTKLLAR
jgi:tetratricopeptide (TPR) repeat protein